MVASIILVIVLGSVVAVSYILNKNTKVPKECENIKFDCEGCRIVSCINHPLKGEENVK